MIRLILAISIFFFIASCNQKKEAVQADVFYTCSMDPQVVSNKPGKCPICGMPLTPVKKSAVKDSDDLELSDQQIQLGNITVDTIREESIGGEMELTGTLHINASKTSSVSARIMGRIEKLFVKTTGDFVAKGSLLYELYSEELNSAKQEYISALQRRNLFHDQSTIDFENLVEGARAKLQLWGMTKAQITVLEKETAAPSTTQFYSPEGGYVISLDVTEGEYVMEGASILQLADLSTLWAEAQVYTTQLHLIPTGAAATVSIPGSDFKFTGRIEFANPELSGVTRLNLLRVVVPNAKNLLRPGMSVLVTVQNNKRTTLTLPTDAVIRDAQGATVWIQTKKNRFRSQMVTTGVESNGQTEIVSGLKIGDEVVTSGTYLLNSEFVFKRGTDPMKGHNH